MTEEMPPIPGPWEDSYWVIPGKFLAGAYPGEPHYRESKARMKIGAILESGVTTFVNLTKLYELEPYDVMLTQEAEWRDLKAKHIHFPIRDFGVPTPEELKEILDIIDAAIAAGKGVYVHCWVGIGRTGTVVAAYLIRHGMSPKEALGRLAELRQNVPDAWRTSPESELQWELVLSWKPGM